MEISNTMSLQANYSNTTHQSNIIEVSSQEDAQKLQLQMQEQSVSFSDLSFSAQLSFTTNEQSSLVDSNYEAFQSFLQDINYEGKNIAELSQSEATELVEEDGFFGVNQTSERLANFVINGAGDNESLLRAGKSGLLEGMKQAEAMWGGELPEISQKSMSIAIETIDKHMASLGYSILDSEA